MPIITPVGSGGGGGGSLPATWTATDNNLVIPVVQNDGTTADAQFALTEIDTGLVLDRAGGFVSDIELFDLGRPGVGYGEMRVTAVVADGETFGFDSGDLNWTLLSAAISPDGVNWLVPTAPGSLGTGDQLVGIGTLAYWAFTPRFIRFQSEIQDVDSGNPYAGPNNPTVTYDFVYTAG